MRFINQSSRNKRRSSKEKEMGVGGALQHDVGKSEYQLAHAAVVLMQFGAFYCRAHMQVAMGDSFRRRVRGKMQHDCR